MYTTVILIVFTFNFPCYKTETYQYKVKEASFEKEISLSVDRSSEWIVTFPKSNIREPCRIFTKCSSATAKFPVLIAVKQEQQVIAWQIPMILTTTSGNTTEMAKTARTICFDKDEYVMIRGVQAGFNVHISTSSPISYNITIIASPVHDYYLKENQNYTVTISPSEPAFFIYTRSKNETVKKPLFIAVSSPDDTCFTVSVQNPSCPVRDLNTDIQYGGRYQAIINKGGIFISETDFPNGFFLVFVTKTDDLDCLKSLLPNEESKNSILNRTTTVSFSIFPTIFKNEYLSPILIVFGTNLAICVFVFIIAALSVNYSIPWSFCNLNCFSKTGRDNHEEKKEDVDESREPISGVAAPHDKKLYEMRSIRLSYLIQNEDIHMKKTESFFWYTINIGLFYSIPVAQLMVFYQRFVNDSGNTDICYHNFYCSRPFGIFTDFNHIYSNIGYVMFGFTFIAITFFRRIYKKSVPGHGIPKQYGVFYAMGCSLILEGLMSGFYHVCPTQLNFQFDTSFMYIIGILCLVKLYQSRHPLKIGAYGTFTLLGMIVFVALLGIFLESKILMGLFVAFYLSTCVYFSLKIYFLGNAKEGLARIFRSLRSKKDASPKTQMVLKKSLLVLITLIDIFSLFCCIFGFYSTTNFASFLLNIIMVNLGIYLLFYIVMKCINRECICLEALVYLILAVAIFGCANDFYTDLSSNWELSAAESKHLNKDCYSMGFYDTHDIWHLLSAPALFFAFMMMQCIDDDLVGTPHLEIEVF